MKSALFTSAVALAVALGWLEGGTAALRQVSDPVVGTVLEVAYGTPAHARPATGRPVVTVEDGQPLAQVDERFISVALDTSQVLGGHWWSRSAREVEIGRGAHRTAPFDFAQPRLQRLTAALAPAYLRVGGTEADVVHYDVDSPVPPSSPPRGYELTLDRERWDALNAFTRQAGLDLVFTVNGGPGPRGPDGRWTTANAESLLEYTRAAGYQVPVWELGNEVDAYWFTHGLSARISGKGYAEDVARFAGRVHAVLPGAKVAGPGAFFWPVMGEAASVGTDFMGEFLQQAGSSVDIVTWHYYPQQSRRCPLATRPASLTRMLDPVALDEMASWADRIGAKNAASGAHLWLGETGNAQCGGEPGVSDRFASSLWWVDELGLAAAHGQAVVVRQTLVGSNYGLIDDVTGNPNPDYWASLLWKRAMGPVVLRARTSDDDPSVRAYAHCAPAGDGGVSLLLVNLHADRPARVRMGGYDAAAASLYLVTSPSLSSREADLNGAPLRFADEAPSLEPRGGALAADGSLELPAASYAFVTFPDAGSLACKAH